MPERIEDLPASPFRRQGLGWWGSAVLLVANASLFLSLLFAAAFLAVVAPGWTDLPPDDAPGVTRMAALLVIGAGGSLLLWAGLRPQRKDPGVYRILVGTGILAIAGGALVAGVSMGGSPIVHARFAVQGAILAYLAAHTLILVVMHLAAMRGHRIGVQRIATQGVLAHWHGYTGLVAVIGALALLLVRL